MSILTNDERQYLRALADGKRPKPSPAPIDPVSYEPSGPLEIDVRDLPPDEISIIREAKGLNKAELSRLMGLCDSAIRNRERLDGYCKWRAAGWCAVLREYHLGNLDLPLRRANVYEFRAVAQLLGGWRGVASAFGKPYETVKAWTQIPPVRGGYRELIGWLCDEMSLEPVGNVEAHQ